MPFRDEFLSIIFCFHRVVGLLLSLVGILVLAKSGLGISRDLGDAKMWVPGAEIGAIWWSFKRAIEPSADWLAFKYAWRYRHMLETAALRERENSSGCNTAQSRYDTFRRSMEQYQASGSEGKEDSEE